MPSSVFKRRAALLITCWAMTGPLLAQPGEPHRPVEEQVSVERPPAGQGRRGLISAPAWVVWTAAGAVAGSGVLLLARLARKGVR